MGYALVFVFGAMALLQTALAIRYNLFFLLVAALFGAAAYMIWYHASGRMERNVHRRVAAGERAEPRGGFGAGPREQRFRSARRGPRSPGAQRRRTDRATPSTAGPSPREASRILGVTADADRQQIRDAYREKVKTVHPDTEGGDEEQFKRVTRAYEALTDG